MGAQKALLKKMGKPKLREIGAAPDIKNSAGRPRPAKRTDDVQISSSLPSSPLKMSLAQQQLRRSQPSFDQYPQSQLLSRQQMIARELLQTPMSPLDNSLVSSLGEYDDSSVGVVDNKSIEDFNYTFMDGTPLGSANNSQVMMGKNVGVGVLLSGDVSLVDNQVKLLRDRYNTCKLRAAELATANPAMPTYLRLHSEQAGRVYSALSTLLYASVSIVKVEELERYIRKKATQLPRAMFDLDEWAMILNIARECRSGDSVASGISEERGVFQQENQNQFQHMFGDSNLNGLSPGSGENTVVGGTMNVPTATTNSNANANDAMNNNDESVRQLKALHAHEVSVLRGKIAQLEGMISSNNATSPPISTQDDGYSSTTNPNNEDAKKEAEMADMQAKLAHSAEALSSLTAQAQQLMGQIKELTGM